MSVGTALNIADVASDAFDVQPGSESVAIGVSPQASQISGANYTFNQSSFAFSFLASAAGVIVSNSRGFLTSEPGKELRLLL